MEYNVDAKVIQIIIIVNTLKINKYVPSSFVSQTEP